LLRGLAVLLHLYHVNLIALMMMMMKMSSLPRNNVMSS